MLGGKEGELGEVREGAEGWEALRFLRSPPTGTRTCFVVGRPSPRGLGSSYLLQLLPEAGWPRGGLQGDAAQLGSRPEQEEMRRP